MRKTLYTIGLLCCIIGCTEHDSVTGFNGLATPITINSEYPTTKVMTRATLDGGFVAGDEIGIFVVDYDDEGHSGTMTLQGNRASNIRFTLKDDGTWQAATQLYWSTKGRAADFYGYYPFNANLSLVTAQPFSVQQNQNSEATETTLAGYTASDLLWAKKEKVEPTTETITLQYHHLMAGVNILLEQGTGFSSEEWTDFDKEVYVTNTVLNATVDLSTGQVSKADGTPSAIIRPLSTTSGYRAIVVPQTVEAGKALVQVNIDGQTYSLKKTEAMTFIAGKMHQFTIVVDRSTATGEFTFSLADEAIIPWVDEGDLHEGLVHQYIIVDVKHPGTFGEIISQQVDDLTRVFNLKLSGNINQDDIYFLWENLPNITRLNLQKAVIEDGVLNGVSLGQDIPRNHPLESIIYPEKGLKEINGFIGCSLKGSLIIPEGVERLGWHVFSNNPLSGTVSLPSTLRYTDVICEYNYRLHGDLILPDGLIEWNGIGGNYTGTMYLPSSLKKISWMPSGLTGTIKIPQGCEIGGGAFENSHCTAVILPEGMTEIPGYCFRGSHISGEVVIPSTVTKIGGHSFRESKITKVIFPDGLRILEDGNYDDDGPFSETRLSGTLVLPKHVVRIPKGCFYGCNLITGLVIPKETKILDNNSFAGCGNISSIVCEGEEPPVVVGNAFLGVPKDNFTVEVPKGCVETYRNAIGWSEFKRISEYSNFVCRPAQACALRTPHQEELVLNADDSWTVSSKPDWVTLSKTSGTGKTSITMTFTPLTRGQGNREGIITFAMGSYETTCKVSQYDYEYDEDSYLALQTAKKGNRGGINIVFVGDGFDAASISDGSYLDLVRYQTECFFGIEPYKSMRDYFNVYVTFPLSQEKGVNTMNTYVNNRFGTLYGMNALASVETTSTALFTESDEVFRYVVDNTPVEDNGLWHTLVILVPNSTDYEGHTEYTWDGKTMSICPPSENPYPRDTRGVIQHEAGGHGFGRLGDEMIARNLFAPVAVKEHIEKMHNQGYYANLATTGKLSSVPWAEFIFDTDYSDYVDVYEGGYGFTRGIYRPEANSCMNYGIPYYNTPSRLSIYRRILDYAGEEFRMENFRAQDTFEWGDANITRAVAHDVNDLTPITAGNHHEPIIIKYREVGDRVRAVRKKLRGEK